MKKEANKIGITQIAYPHTKLCNFYQPDARSNRATLQKMYRNDFRASHDLPVPKLFTIIPITRKKYQKNTIRHRSTLKAIEQQPLSHKNVGQGRGLHILMVGRAPRASHARWL